MGNMAHTRVQCGICTSCRIKIGASLRKPKIVSSAYGDPNALLIGHRRRIKIFKKCVRLALTGAAKSVVCNSPVAFIRAKTSFGRSRALVGNASWWERLSLSDEPEAMPLPTPMDPWFWGAGTRRQVQIKRPALRAVFHCVLRRELRVSRCGPSVLPLSWRCRSFSSSSSRRMHAWPPHDRDPISPRGGHAA
jgi:hypothetical protein